ncbi:MAG: hypothetical protein GY854_09880 [Deltaproteobacteria bacterium]|nr:hypothetical protein [Deltaproteobacteria bacterium]
MKCLLSIVCMALVIMSAYACYQSEGVNTSEVDTEHEHPRASSIDSEHEHYDYYEGASGENSCSGDHDCVISGCIGSTCAAESIEINDTAFCEERSMLSMPEPRLSRCGCVNNECKWYYENDFDRDCETDEDCRGLGFPPEGPIGKCVWSCLGNECNFCSPVE